MLRRSRVADPDYFGKLDPDPQKSEKLHPIHFKVKKKFRSTRSSKCSRETPRTLITEALRLKHKAVKCL
jgi:hypothetical protein